MNSLEYEESGESNISPHFDDFWIWGEFIIGINLLQDTVMSFYKETPSGRVGIDVPIPRRGLYIMFGKARYEFMHGISKENIKGRGLVITFREMTKEFIQEYPEISSKLIEISRQELA